MIAVLLNGSPDQRAAMVEFVTSHFHREEDPGYGRVFLNDGFDVGLLETRLHLEAVEER